MNQYDVAGILQKAALQARLCRKSESLREVVRQLKRELNAETIRSMRIGCEDKEATHE